MTQKQTKIIPLLPNASIKYIQDPELKDIYDVVNWNLINRLLADKNYTPGKREILPVQFFKAELLKNLKYAEFSYRKYTANEINNLERKQYRAFIGLKRDQSTFVVGYRLHTLTVIDAKTEIAYPLLSILAPANHHDSNFLELLVDFGKKIGLNLNIVTTDQAYGDRYELEYIHNKYLLELSEFRTYNTNTERRKQNLNILFELINKDIRPLKNTVACLSKKLVSIFRTSGFKFIHWLRIKFGFMYCSGNATRRLSAIN